MAKAADASVLDALLAKIGTATLMTVCSAQPTTRAEAAATFMLADVVMVGGDYVLAAAAASGRQTTVAAKAGVVVDNTGTANHIAWCDATILLEVTTCTSQALTAANTVNIPAIIITATQPT